MLHVIKNLPLEGMEGWEENAPHHLNILHPERD